MNIYVKYTDDWLDIGHECTVFYEINNDYATRQLLLSEDKFVGSNRKDGTLGYFLAEGNISIENFENSEGEFEIISEKDFEEMWLKHCKSYKDKWVRSKSKFKTGMQVQGAVEILYPQGVIIKLDEDTIAIADYDECLKNSSYKSLYPHQYVTGKVKGYDEINMWIVLEKPKITS